MPSSMKPEMRARASEVRRRASHWSRAAALDEPFFDDARDELVIAFDELEQNAQRFGECSICDVGICTSTARR